ncbi:MAG TPA: RagB/SusD family nutrient uptake outer membrane protein [Paludibacter sp.]
MKTKKQLYLILALLGIFFSSCNDYLNFPKVATTKLDDSFISATSAVQSATACYAPLTWEYQNGGGTFFNEWFIGDVCSDDALKGSNTLSDMGLLFDMENFKTKSDNNTLLQYYRCQYIGIFRCNLVYEYVPAMNPALFAKEKAGLQNRVLAEASFLRAMYYFRLVRVYGGVPVVNHVIKAQSDWKQPRATESGVYDQIYSDLKFAIKYLPERNGYAATDLGRATKGSARGLLIKAYMNNHDYNNAKLQGDTLINSTQYALVPNYNDIFTVAGENNSESVFEIQYVMEGTSDVWNGEGFTRGNITPMMVRPRWATGTLIEGWGFNRPTQELYDEFEPGDPRRDAAIYAPTLDQVAASDDNTNNINVYLGDRYTSRKYSMMNPDTTWISSTGQSSRGEINKKEIRYADVLLMYAEACLKQSAPDVNQAKWALEQVRNRARITAGKPTILPAFPNYTIPLQGVGQSGTKQLQDNADDLYLAIQHERRVELAMEGHRWFDLKRWGLLSDVMNHYKEFTKPQISTYMDPFVKGKDELFPIPLQERDLNSPMPQNPGYDGVPVQ